MRISALRRSKSESNSILPYYTSTRYNGIRLAPGVDVSTAKTRLEVLSAFEINVATICMYASSFLALIYVFVSLSLANNEWKNNKKFLPKNVFDELASSLLRKASFVLPIIYDTALFLDGSATLEQKWTAVILSIGLVCSNPLSFAYYNWKQFYIYNDVVYHSATLLYVLITIHSYRILDSKKLNFVSVYRGYGYIVSASTFVRLISAILGKVSTSIIPFTTFLTWYLLPAKDREPDEVTAVVLLITVMDIFILLTVIKEISTTRRFLTRQRYLEHRTKQLGFRCFEYQLMIFCASMITISAFSIIGLPSRLMQKNMHRFDFITQLDISISRVGLFFIFFSWTAITAFVNLPPTPIFTTNNRTLLNFVYNLSLSALGRWIQKHRVPRQTKSSTENCADSVEDRNDLGTERFRNQKMIPFQYSDRERFERMEFSISELEDTKRSMKFNVHDEKSCFSHIQVYSGSKSIQPPRPCAEHEGIFPFPEFILVSNSHNDLCQKYNSIESPVHNNYRPPNAKLGVCIPIRFGCTAGFEYFQDKKRQINIVNPGLYTKATAYKNNYYGSVETSGFTTEKKLWMQENLFVMETQILLAQVSYLAYIPGNGNEEFIRPTDEEKQVTDLLEGKKVLSEDDGSKFLVDVAEITAQNGYFVYRQISNKETNTHATVLLGNGRVIIGFSGTRDKKNWGTNSRMQRSVFDELFSDFEHELTNTKMHVDVKKQNYDLFEIAENSNLEFQDCRNTKRSKSESYFLPAENNINPASYTECDISKRRTLSEYFPVLDDNFSKERKKSDIAESFAVTLAHEVLTYGKAKVHSGFAEAYRSVRKCVLRAMIELYGGDNSILNYNLESKAIGKNLPIMFCGHSLGGALAIFAAYDAARYFREIGIGNREKISCSTFGCPMVGNEIFKRRYETVVKNHWRFEIASDPVPDLPSSLFNYTHVGTKVLLDQSGMLLIDPSFIETSFWGKHNNFYTRYKLHTRASYISALRSYCKKFPNESESLESRFWTFPIKSQTRGFFETFED